MAKLAKQEFSDQDRERLAVTLEELAELVRTQPERIMDVTLSWEKDHPPVWIDEETYKGAPTVYSFSLRLSPLEE